MNIITRDSLKGKHISDLIFRRDEFPFGKSWEEWTVLWWKWLLAIPKDRNPGLDCDGTKFDPLQEDPNVIFLPGTYGGYAVRSYTIPPRKALLFPVINFTTSFSEEPQLKTDSDLISRAIQDIHDIRYLEATINEASISHVKAFQVMSPAFDIDFCENNVLDLKPGKTRAISNGYWLFLKLLPSGRTVIKVAGSCSTGRTNLGVTWHIDVLQELKT